MKFDEFVEGQRFQSSFTISLQDFENYIAAARTQNKLLKTGTKDDNMASGIMIPGRLLIARTEGEMTRLAEFAENEMVLYGMDGDLGWGNRQTRFVSQACVGENLKVEYVISAKTVHSSWYGNLAIDFEIKKNQADDKPVVVSKKNLYRLKR